MSSIANTGRAGVYVHVPFCLRHCPYCDFTVAVVKDIPAVSYTDRVLLEWHERKDMLDGREVRTLYFGGGTPSLLPAACLADIVRAVSVGRQLVEVTLEANPERVSVADATAWERAGVSRVSLGVQSLQPDILNMTGRSHSPTQAIDAIVALHAAGVAHVSADLIFGVPGQRLEQVLADIDTLASTGIDHVSLYELTFEPGTSFDRRRKRGELQAKGDVELMEWSLEIEERLRAHGFDHYEVSNFARPGGHAVHNRAYWAGDEYLGLGTGAHSMSIESQGEGVVRRANDRSLQRYLSGKPVPEIEILTRKEHAFELLMTGTRQRRGVDLDDLSRRLGLAFPPALARAVSAWEVRGWVTRTGGLIRPTPAGLWQADSMAEDALTALDEIV